MPTGQKATSGRRRGRSGAPRELTHREKINMGLAARQAAVASLIEKHKDEFDKTLRKERTERGLPAEADGNKRVPIEDKIARAKKRLADLEAEAKSA